MIRLVLPRLLFSATALLLICVSITSSCTTRRTATRIQTKTETVREPVNINIADAEALERLPNIGPSLATKILEHRNRYGPFRRVEHLLVVDGMGESRFREIEHLISIE